MSAIQAIIHQAIDGALAPLVNPLNSTAQDLQSAVKKLEAIEQLVGIKPGPEATFADRKAAVQKLAEEKVITLLKQLGETAESGSAPGATVLQKVIATANALKESALLRDILDLVASPKKNDVSASAAQPPAEMSASTKDTPRLLWSERDSSK